MADTMSYHNDAASSWNPALKPDETHGSSQSELVTSTSEEPASQSQKQSGSMSADDREMESELPLKGDPAHSAQPATNGMVADSSAAVEEPNQSDDTHQENHVQEHSHPSDNIRVEKSPEIQWDNDIDFAEELRSASSPFAANGIVGRTNSFPAVPHDATDEKSDARKESASEQLVSPQNGSFNVGGESAKTNGDIWHDNEADEEGAFFDELKMQTKPIPAPSEADSRYEEGVPLVQRSSNSPEDPASKSPTQLDSIFADDDGDDFFNSVASTGASNTDRPAVTRKSTAQVIESLSRDSAPPPADSVPTEERQPTPTGGEISTEKTTGTSEAVDEEDLAARWQQELDSDDELLPADEASQPTPATQEHQPVEPASGVTAPYTQPDVPLAPVAPMTTTNPYAPHQPSSTEMVQGLPTTPYTYSSTPHSLTPPQSQPAPKPQSFLQAKEGYKSPYDLPEDLTRPRRPAAARKTIPSPSYTAMATPPRSGSVSSMPPPPPASTAVSQSIPAPSKGTSAPATGNFFEELPPRDIKSTPPRRSQTQSPSAQNAAPSLTMSPPGPFPRPASVNAPPAVPKPANPYAPPPPRRSQTQSPSSQMVGSRLVVTPVEPFPRPASVNTPPSPPKSANPYARPAPRRSQTQSPGSQLAASSLTMTSVEPYPRPASVQTPRSPPKTTNPYAASQVPRETPQLNFIPPTDGQELDPLERWKGAPIFKFGFGGAVVSCFPQHIPRYTAGQMTPMIKSAPGEVRVRHFKDVLPPADSGIVRYPGPLRAKSKKKEVIAWLSARIAFLENEGMPPVSPADPQAYKIHEDKILLWKVIRALVEHDGSLEGTPEIAKSLRDIISPGLRPRESETASDRPLSSGGLYSSTSGGSQPDAVNHRLLEQIRDDLLIGEREKAVWRAVDNRLWGHAMIMASALDRLLWKQVIQEFVRREVRAAGDGVESLAALYEILAGNVEECVDELVPPSARAGLQMISKSDGQGSATKNALDGLDKWRETLGLVLNNRCPGDAQALISLAQLLLSYNRTEAAHTCLIFARAFSAGPVFGGLDDPHAAIVLLGVDHRRFPTTFSRDEDAILLTEVYEFATSILTGNAAASLPHLQPFKLQHANILAESGYKAEAQQYCDAIAATLKASTKLSPYYHQRLFSEVDELSSRLKQAPSDGSSSWMKPNMSNLSDSMWAKFSSFVAGDDSDAVSHGSGKAEEIGPFAKMTGTPTISYSPSTTDLYGSSAAPPSQPMSSAASRYAPVSNYVPSSPPDERRARSSLDAQRSTSLGIQFPPQSAPTSGYEPPTLQPSGPPTTSYEPPTLQPAGGSTPAYEPPSFQPSGGPTGGYESPSLQPAGEPTGGYEPPSLQPAGETTTGYEPPSLQAAAVESEGADGHKAEEEEEQKPKKKSFMDDDDDDDLVARAAALQKAEKARRDREVDETVRKAAEADGT